MCVIMACQDAKPTEEMIRAAFATNGDGGGVAWREFPEIDGKKRPVVRWKKGIDDVEEMVRLSADLTLPFVLHFRKQSVGPKTKEMCHPFPVAKGAPLELEGQTSGQVLFHNGTWHQWESESIKAAFNGRVKLPRGPFSDTRMMAWITHMISPGFLDLIKEKVLLFGTDDDSTEIFAQDRDWTLLENVWCSNDIFYKRMKASTNTASNNSTTEMGPRPLRDLTRQHDGRGGDRQPAGFCGGPLSLGIARSEQGRTSTNLEKSDEGRSEGFRGRVASGIICAVENLGQAPKGRHALTENPRYQQEYKKLHGHPPPFRPRVTEDRVIGNSKRFRSSGRPGGTSDHDLSQRRHEADRGISRVLDL
jgi:hypothetical protein